MYPEKAISAHWHNHFYPLDTVAGNIVGGCSAPGCVGSLGGWILTVSQSAKEASGDGLFADIFSKTNEACIPIVGLTGLNHVAMDNFKNPLIYSGNKSAQCQKRQRLF